MVKRYGAALALEGCDFTLARGEIHVLMGANGCGKSTLCKIIAGAVRRDSGTVEIDGVARSFASPHEARTAGLATVYQELSLVPSLSIAENILLGVEPVTRARLVDAAARRRRVLDLVARTGLGIGLDPDQLVADLSVDQRQLVEILKALATEPSILLLDEATSSLDRGQVAAVFTLVRHLAQSGRSIIFISHRIEEIFAIGDTVTVMRDGRAVATRAIKETTREELVELMVGQRQRQRAARVRATAGPVALEVTALEGARLRGCSFSLHEGEILGLGGLHGQGQSDLLLTLFGARPAAGGTVRLGQVLWRARRPIAAIRAGFAYVSGDRGRAGAFPGRPIFENLVLSLLRREGRRLVDRRSLRARLGPLVARLQLKFGGFAAPLASLSGGNQQKVILGRALAAAPRIVLLDDPTKGIDVEAKRDLYALIAELARNGVAVLLYSSEDQELLDNADRVLVFNGGQIVRELVGERLTEFDLYSAALEAAA